MINFYISSKFLSYKVQNLAARSLKLKSYLSNKTFYSDININIYLIVFNLLNKYVKIPFFLVNLYIYWQVNYNNKN